MLKITFSGGRYFQERGYDLLVTGAEITRIEAEDWVKNGDTECHITPLGLFKGSIRLATAF